MLVRFRQGAQTEDTQVCEPERDGARWGRGRFQQKTTCDPMLYYKHYGP